MPVQTSNIIPRPFDEQFSLGGAQYVRNSLHYTFNRMRLQSTAHLRKSGWP
jgi:hypothetical protein